MQKHAGDHSHSHHDYVHGHSHSHDHAHSGPHNHVAGGGYTSKVLARGTRMRTPQTGRASQSALMSKSG